MRAGRFDRQIHVDLPDLKEREDIFNVHLRGLKLTDDFDLEFLAKHTPGFSGADIANVCNEAALIAARHKKSAVGKQDFLDAVDRIIGGLEKKTRVMTAHEKRTIAIHEAGHATLSWFLEHANPLIKVTIVPRGRALGAAWYLPEERQITTKEQMLDEMCATLGGRAAEELFTGHISTGAMNDLERVTKQSYGMIAYAGMSDKLPNLCYYNNDEYSFSKPYSELTLEELQKVHAVPYLIWANYDLDESAAPKETSNCYLTNVLFEVGNIRKSTWLNMVDEYQQAYPVITTIFTTDAQGLLSETPILLNDKKKIADDLLIKYQKYSYGILCGIK
jgi:ATP-dependent Zn protease